MMKEGIHVDITCPHNQTEEQKRLLEERMMWLGRNDLFRVIDFQDGKDTYDLIFIQSEEPDKRQEDLKAAHGMYRVLYEKTKTNHPIRKCRLLFFLACLDHGHLIKKERSVMRHFCRRCGKGFVQVGIRL